MYAGLQDGTWCSLECKMRTSLDAKTPGRNSHFATAGVFKNVENPIGQVLSCIEDIVE
jgi:hypothetical protein